MCTAIEELIEDGRAEGRADGMDEKTKKFVANLLQAGMPDSQIRQLAECDQELIDAVRKSNG